MSTFVGNTTIGGAGVAITAIGILQAAGGDGGFGRTGPGGGTTCACLMADIGGGTGLGLAGTGSTGTLVIVTAAIFVVAGGAIRGILGNHVPGGGIAFVHGAINRRLGLGGAGAGPRLTGISRGAHLSVVTETSIRQWLGGYFPDLGLAGLRAHTVGGIIRC